MLFMMLGVAGLIAAWRQGRRPPSALFQLGLILAGWGVFNLVEGVLDHLVLGAHHVRDDLGGPLSWDIGFLVLGAVLVLVGVAMHRAGDRSS